MQFIAHFYSLLMNLSTKVQDPLNAWKDDLALRVLSNWSQMWGPNTFMLLSSAYYVNSILVFLIKCESFWVKRSKRPFRNKQKWLNKIKYIFQFLREINLYTRVVPETVLVWKHHIELEHQIEGLAHL